MTDALSPAGNEPERIAKYLSRAGLCSRRDAEKLIEDGRVSVDGEVLTTPAVKVTEANLIEVDGIEVAPPERTRMWRYHKPKGLVTTARDPEGRATVFENLPQHMPRVISIGRLDINSEGLLLLTNDGGVARRLELPATGWSRRYRVRVHGTVDAAALEKLRNGITVDGVRYGAIEAVPDAGKEGRNQWLTVSIREGKNREVRRVLGALGLDVNRLIRVAYGPFQLGDLSPGAVEEVETRVIRDQLGRGPKGAAEKAGPEKTGTARKKPLKTKPGHTKPKKKGKPGAHRRRDA